MKEKRRFVRYDVSHFPALKAGIKNGPIGERLMTISEGGCGFWAPSEDFNLRLGEKVHIHLYMGEFSHETRILQGEVLYILPHPMESQIGRLYGIRFREEEIGQIHDLITYLEDQLQQGKIKASK